MFSFIRIWTYYSILRLSKGSALKYFKYFMLMSRINKNIKKVNHQIEIIPCRKFKYDSKNFYNLFKWLPMKNYHCLFKSTHKQENVLKFEIECQRYSQNSTKIKHLKKNYFNTLLKYILLKYILLNYISILLLKYILFKGN